MEKKIVTVLDHETLGKVGIVTIEIEPCKLHGEILEADDDGKLGALLNYFEHEGSAEAFHTKLRAKKSYYVEYSTVLD